MVRQQALLELRVKHFHPAGYDYPEARGNVFVNQSTRRRISRDTFISATIKISKSPKLTGFVNGGTLNERRPFSSQEGDEVGWQYLRNIQY
jgi:hypothetical protein